MIQINDKYFISADSKNYILKEKYTVKDEESKNFGNEVYKDLGYFGKLENLIQYVVGLKTKEYIAKDKINTLDELIKKMEKINKDVNKQFNIARKNEN